MAKQYDNFFAQFTVSVNSNSGTTPSESNARSLSTGIIYIGSRFQDVLLKNDNIYKKLGFKLNSDLDSSTVKAVKNCTRLILASQTAGQRLAVYRVFSLVLVPKNSAKTVAPYGKKYPTRIPAAFSVPEAKAVKTLYNAEFKFKLGEELIIYTVESGSIMLVRGKKTAARFPKVQASEAPADELFVFEDDIIISDY